jgi:hypothetical protein
MKQLKAILLTGCIVFFTALLHAQPTTPFVLIRQIGVGDGDCALMIIGDYQNPSATVPANSKLNVAVIIIDGQRKSEANLNAIGGTIDDILTSLHLPKYIDYVVSSHLHTDHIGGTTNLIDALLAYGYVIGTVIDRVKICSTMTDLAWTDSNISYCEDYDGSFNDNPSQTAESYKTYMNLKSTDSIFNWTSKVPGDDLLAPFNFQNAKMDCLTSAGLYLTSLSPATYTSFLQKNAQGYYQPKNENDLSYAFLLSFAGFHYLTGGDIGGGDPYTDGETPIITSMQLKYPTGYHSCVLKVSHHGSTSSTNPAFLAYNNPTVAVIPASKRKFNGSPLPSKETVDQLNVYIPFPANLLFTFIPYNPTVISSYYDGLAPQYLQDIQFYVDYSAGYGYADIPIQVTKQTRDTKSKQLIDDPYGYTVLCTKDHTIFMPATTTH